VVSGVFTIISGRLCDRFGPRKVVSAGALIMGAGYILTSRITELWQLYFCYGVLVAIGTSAMYVPPVTMITRWFTKRRGLMSGIAIAGIGLGLGVMPTIASQIVVSLDWRASILVVGSASMVGIVGLARLLKKEEGAEKSQLTTKHASSVRMQPSSIQPDSSDSLRKASSTEAVDRLSPRGQLGLRWGDNGKSTGPTVEHLVGYKAPPPNNFTFKQAIKTRQFWMIFVAWVFYGFFFQVGVVHIVPYATDLGMTAVAAATVLTVIGITGIPGRVALGLVGDRLGNRNTIYAAFAIVAAAFVGLTLSGSTGTLYGFAVVFGALSGTGILLIPFIAEYFGPQELGVISGTIVFSNSLGGAISPPLAGAIFDATGSYEWAFILCAILGFLAFLIILRLRPARKTA